MGRLKSNNRRSCKYPHCSKKAQSLGYCSTHYKQYKRAQAVLKNEKYLKPCHPYDYHAVYVVGCDEFEFLKVGRSKDVGQRLKDINIYLPFDLKIYDARFGHPEVVMALETEMHRILRECDVHKRGEWFEILPSEASEVLDKCISMHQLYCLDAKSYHKKCMENGGMNLERFKRPDEDDRRFDIVAEIERNKRAA